MTLCVIIRKKRIVKKKKNLSNFTYLNTSREIMKHQSKRVIRLYTTQQQAPKRGQVYFISPGLYPNPELHPKTHSLPIEILS